MDDIILFRIAERMTLTVVVLLIAFTVMVGFWRTVQKLDVSNTGGFGGSFVFSTPVFVLLAIIGYAWVSLEHPIQVAAPAKSEGEPVQTAGTGSGSFIGSSATPDVHAGAIGLSKAERRVRSLNCLAQGQSLSPRLKDDLDNLKLAQLEPFWPEAWGSFAEFEAWAIGSSTTPPNEAARTAYERAHIAC